MSRTSSLDSTCGGYYVPLPEQEPAITSEQLQRSVPLEPGAACCPAAETTTSALIDGTWVVHVAVCGRRYPPARLCAPQSHAPLTWHRGKPTTLRTTRLRGFGHAFAGTTTTLSRATLFGRAGRRSRGAGRSCAATTSRTKRSGTPARSACSLKRCGPALLCSPAPSVPSVVKSWLQN